MGARDLGVVRRQGGVLATLSYHTQIKEGGRPLFDFGVIPEEPTKL
jgi:hypothetical protein